MYVFLVDLIKTNKIYTQFESNIPQKLKHILTKYFLDFVFDSFTIYLL